MIRKFAIAAVLVLCVALNAWAQEEMMSLYSLYRTQMSDPQLQFIEFINAKESQEEYFSDKLGDGMINIVTCWTDIPRKIGDVSEESNVFLGSTLGLGEGILFGIARGAAGTYDTGTSILPPFNAEPLMKAEYKVDNPNRDGLKIALISW